MHLVWQPEFREGPNPTPSLITDPRMRPKISAGVVPTRMACYSTTPGPHFN